VVPAPAVIPAPRAYSHVVGGPKLGVGWRVVGGGV
jgi:hypothetical protein